MLKAHKLRLAGGRTHKRKAGGRTAYRHASNVMNANVWVFAGGRKRCTHKRKAGGRTAYRHDSNVMNANDRALIAAVR